MKEKNKKNKVKGLIQLIIIAVIILLFLVFCGKKEGLTVTFNIDGKEYYEMGIRLKNQKIQRKKDITLLDGFWVKKNLILINLLLRI